MRSRFSCLTFIVATILSVTLFGPAHSQPSDAMKACLGRGKVTLDQRVAACSSIIEAGAETSQNLALAYGERAIAKTFQKDIGGARKDLEESIRRDSSSAASYRFRGALALIDSDEKNASEAFRKAIEIDPRYGPAYAGLGMLAGRRGAATSAIELLSKSIELDPDSRFAYLFRGRSRIQMDAYDWAIDDFTAALNGPEPPEPAEVLFSRGSAFAHKGEHRKALADYDEGLRLKTDRGEPFAIRCAIRAALGQRADEVLQDCEKALGVEHFALVVRNMRGFALVSLDRPNVAVKEFNTALASVPRPAPRGIAEGQAMALFGRGLARQRLGDAQESAKDIELALKLSPKIRQRATLFFGIKQ